jgi:hypothetical protein
MQKAQEEAAASEAKFEERVASELAPLQQERQARITALKTEADELRKRFSSALPKLSHLEVPQKPGQLRPLKCDGTPLSPSSAACRNACPHHALIASVTSCCLCGH